MDTQLVTRRHLRRQMIAASRVEWQEASRIPAASTSCRPPASLKGNRLRNAAGHRSLLHQNFTEALDTNGERNETGVALQSPNLTNGR